MFELKKAKLNKSGGLVVEYIGMGQGQGPHPISESISSPVHLDLKAAFDRLKIALVRTMKTDWPFRALAPDLLSKPEEIEAYNTLKWKMDEAHESLVESIGVNGIHLSGEEASSGVIVSGSIETKNIHTSINTPRIVFGRDVFGIESELEMIVDEVVEEVRKYLFEKKHGEVPNLFSELDEGMPVQMIESDEDEEQFSGEPEREEEVTEIDPEPVEEVEQANPKKATQRVPTKKKTAKKPVKKAAKKK